MKKLTAIFVLILIPVFQIFAQSRTARNTAEPPPQDSVKLVKPEDDSLFQLDLPDGTVDENNFVYVVIIGLASLLWLVFMFRFWAVRGRLFRTHRKMATELRHAKMKHQELDDKAKKLKAENDNLRTRQELQDKLQVEAEQKLKLWREQQEGFVALEEQKRRAEFDLRQANLLNEKLQKDLELAETDLREKKQRLEALQAELDRQLMPESKQKLEDIELSRAKLDKLKQLRESGSLSQQEYAEAKQKILTEKF